MKRFLIMLMIIGLVAGSVATAEAKDKKRTTRDERTVEGSYGPYPAPVTGCKAVISKFYCLAFRTRAGESFFTAKVTDAHGQPVFVYVRQSRGTNISFCGETTEPIKIDPGTKLSFYVADLLPDSDAALDCPPNRAKTTGTISVTLSNLP
jgi:hypothetical protein